MRERFVIWLWQALIAIDQCVGTLLFGPIYILRDGEPVHADETISSRVGRYQLRGARWARIVAPLIDGLFHALGEAPGHCRRNIEPQFLDPPEGRP